MKNLKLLTGGDVIWEGRLREGHSLLFSDRVLACLPTDLSDGLEAERIEIGPGVVVSPGFIDVHVNGAAGADTLDATDTALDVFSAAMARHGTTAFLPTAVTAPRERLEAATEAVERAMKRPMPGAAVLGMHLEGPWIDVAHKGAHPEEFIEDVPDTAWVEERADVIRFLTFSPLKDPARSFLRRLLDLGIVPSLGHTDAGFEEATEAIEAGAKAVTHLFNAQVGLHHRRPGMLGAAAASQVACELIADGHHVRTELFEPLCRLLGPERIVLVTDSIRSACLSDGEYEFAGRTITLRDGAPRLPDGTLAGSALTMNRAVRNLWRATKRPLPEVVAMASHNPARLLGIERRKGTLTPGADADIVCFDEDVNVLMTFVAGEKVQTGEPVKRPEG